MRVVGYELGKVLKNKKCLLVLLFLVFMYSIMFYQKEQLVNEHSPNDYVRLYEKIQGQTPDQAMEYLEKEKEKISVYREIYNGMLMENREVQYRSLEEYKERFEAEKDAYAEGDFSAQLSLIETVQEEIQNSVTYPEYLEYIRAQQQKNSEISIFQKEETDFSYRNVEKTVRDFATVNEYSVDSLYNARGIVAASGDFSMTVFLLLMGLVFCYFIYGYEKQRQVVMLLKSNYYGQRELAWAKIIAFVILISGLTILLQLINLVGSVWIYGLGDLSRRIQTVPVFVSCPWNWSVLTFLIVQLLLRIVVHIVIIIGCFAAFSKAKNPIAVYAGLIVLYGGEWIIYQQIPGNSLFALLKYCNLYYFTEIPTLLGAYLNVNILNYPVSAVSLFFIVVLCGCVVSSVLAVRWFVQKNSHSIKVRRSIIRRPNRSHGMFWYECYKLFIKQGAILFVVILIVIQYFYIKDYIPSLTIDDIRYERLVEEFRGAAGEKTGEELQKRIRQYEDSEQELMKLEQQLSEDTQTLSVEVAERRGELTKQVQNLSVLKKIRNRNEELSQMTKTQKPELLFEREYDLLTMNRYADLEKALKAILFLLIGITGFLSVDYDTGVVVLQNVCENGRGRLRRVKRMAASVYLFLVFLITYLPDFYLTYYYFGLNQLSAPIYSLAQFTEYSIPMSIGGYLFLKSLFQLVVLYAILGINGWLTKKLKRSVFSFVIMISIFVLPLLYFLR